jgi:hypothetical protein
MIQEFLEIDAISASPTRYVYALGKIQTDLVQMYIARIRANKEQNLLDDVPSFWQYQPTFTREHIRMLQRIKSRIQQCSFNFDIRTGRRVY